MRGTVGGLERRSELSLLQGHLRWLHSGCEEGRQGEGGRENVWLPIAPLLKPFLGTFASVLTWRLLWRESMYVLL